MGFFRHGSQLDAGTGDVICQQHPDFVAGQKQVTAVMRHRNANAVAVGSVANSRSGIFGFAQSGPFCYFPNFQIGIGAGRNFRPASLLFHRDHILDTDAIEDCPRTHIPRAPFKGV